MCRHFGRQLGIRAKPSSDDFLPHFACKVVGDIMRAVMREHPSSKLLVLCGHTHGGGEIQASDNIRVLTGEAEYGKPRISRVLESRANPMKAPGRVRPRGTSFEREWSGSTLGHFALAFEKLPD